MVQLSVRSGAVRTGRATGRSEQSRFTADVTAQRALQLSTQNWHVFSKSDNAPGVVDHPQLQCVRCKAVMIMTPSQGTMPIADESCIIRAQQPFHFTFFHLRSPGPACMQDPPPPPTHFNISRRQRLSDSSSSFWDSCSKFEKVILVLVLFLVAWNIILMGVVGATLHRVLTRVK